MAGEEKKVTVRKKHQLCLKGRENLTIEGVSNVESFDSEELVLETDSGVLLVRGEDMHIKEFNVESGSLAVDGFVRVLEYAGDSPGKKGKTLLARLFK